MNAQAVPFALPPEGIVMNEVEKSLIIQALKRTNNNQAEAARLLGITRDALRYRAGEYGVLPVVRDDGTSIVEPELKARIEQAIQTCNGNTAAAARHLEMAPFELRKFARAAGVALRRYTRRQGAAS